MTPLETVLRLCESAEPKPWYPRTYCEQNQIARETLDPALDQLRMGGLIELTPWVAGLGQGYALTPSGRALLRNPRGLERLSRGELPRPAIDVERAEPFVRRANSDRWLQVKDAVLSSRPAIVS